MDGVGDKLEKGNACWSFGDGVARAFDKHVSRSVPFYSEGHQLVCDIGDFFLHGDSVCYELGCSTGSLTLKLSEHVHPNKPGVRFIGIDCESEMIDVASEKAVGRSNVSFLADDILLYDYESCDMVVAYYTIQFIRPSQRQKIFDAVYEALNWGGAFLLFEKVRANDARFQDITTSLYNEFKLAQGYTPDEIFAKTRSLKGVLEPFSTQANRDFLSRAGFADVLTVFKYVSFEGFLAIK